MSILRWRRCALLLLVALTPGAAASAATVGGWRASWAAPPAPPMAAAPGMPPEFASPRIANQTVVQRVRISAGGSRVRLRLSNEYGVFPLAIGHARVAVLAADGRPVAGSEREVTFAGARAATAAPHAPLLSDAVDLRVAPLATLQVSLFLPGAVEACTCHAVAAEEATLSPPGDYVDRPFTPAGKAQARAFLTAVEVEARADAPGVVAFGDSITDGYRSTTGANRRWPDRVAERLVAAGRPIAVANEGLSGNRVLGDGLIPIFGESALTRFDRDVLGLPGVTHLLVLEGVNDLGGRPTPGADALIAGYRQLVVRAHAHGIKVILATILPYKGAAYFRNDGEGVRGAVNAWIRAQREADGVVDFDHAVRDPADPARMRADLQSGDWLHPNDAGYRVMGDAVALSLLR